MGALQGPLANHENYLRYIALDNAIEYFEERKTIEERGKVNTPDAYRLLRRFVTAVNSLNGVLDYMFHDPDVKHGHKTDTEFVEAVCRNHMELSQLRELANAFKHCVRGRNKGGEFKRDESKLTAHEYSPVDLDASIKINETGLVEIELKFEIAGVRPVDHEALEQAWRFWIEYENKKQTVNWRRP